jgi:type VI secretion system protein ImpE
VLNGKYTWVPFHRVREIRMEQPADLRDMVWAPATFVWSNGGEAPGLVPARYPGSESCADGGLLLSRRTEWATPAEGVNVGLGQRMLATDRGEYALLDVRHVRFLGD